MKLWYFASSALIVFYAPIYAADHDLLTNTSQAGKRLSKFALLDKPAGAHNQKHPTDSPIELTQQIRRRPAPPDPDLHDGQMWLCSVGQPPELNVQAFRRAKAKGWGYWSFAAHAGCPPGVYLAVASGGALKATGENVWTDDLHPNQTLANYTAMPTTSRTARAIQTTRALEPWQPQPVYYALPDASGLGYGFGELDASCAACSGAAGVSNGATIDYGRAAWYYAGDGGGSMVGSSNGYCASCSGR